MLYPKLKIKFEHKTILDKGHKSYIDILIKNEEGLYIPIELKYRTNKLHCNFDDCTYELSNQSAEDITRYGYLKDISRIEKYSETEEKFLTGYAIMLTNQSNVWKKDYHIVGNTFDDFLINDNIIVSSGIKKWSENTSYSNKQNYTSFELKQSYQIKWFDYSDFNCRNGNFKIVITEIKKIITANISKKKNISFIKKSTIDEIQNIDNFKNTIYSDKISCNSQILNEIENYLSDIPIDTIIETGTFRENLSKIYNRPKDCYIPTDYCYDRFNDGINFESLPKFFIYLKRGQVRYVGRNYIYTGPVYHKRKGNKTEIEIGCCANGKYKFY